MLLFRLYTILWLVACVLHTCQTIIFTLGLKVPGNLGDTRFNNLILEHLNSALHGLYGWLSPAQFYPEVGTVVYSDNHLGTFLFYSLFRSAGFSIEGAFQCWQIVISACNAAAAYFLLRTLRVKPLLRGPLAFVAVSSFAFVGKLGHPQVLPLFPFLLALAYVLKFVRSSDLRALSAGLLWYAYLHYCYMYYGYFSTFLLGAVGLLLLFLGANWWMTLRRAPLVAPRRFALLCASGIGSAGALALLYLPYAMFAKLRGWTNPIQLLKEMSPDAGAWFTAQYTSTFYPHFTHLASPLNSYEKSLFAGFLLPIFLIAGFVIGLKHRGTFQGKVLLALNITAVGIVVLITNFPGTNSSLYLLTVASFGPARAFRAFGRFAYLLYPMQAAAAGLCLTLWSRHARARWKHGAVISVAILLAIESLGTRQASFSYVKADAQKRASVIAAKIGGQERRRPFALVVANKPSEPTTLLHLDAFQAALLTKRFCVNGYSGTGPPSHWLFLSDPEVGPLNMLLVSKRLPPRSVDVYSFSAAGHLLSQGIELPDHQGGEYAWGEDILFKSGGRSGEFALSGFVEEGGDFRWTQGTRSVLEFIVPPPSADILLRFGALPLTGRGVKSQTVNILANDTKVATLEMADAWEKEYDVRIPNVVLNGARRLALTFAVPNATTPARLGINDDGRVLGIAFRHLQLQLVEGSGSNAGQYSWGETVLFRKGGRSNEFVRAGFTEEGGEWRWTEGTRSSLEIKTPPSKHERALHVEAIPLIGAGLASQTVRVIANQQLVGTWEMKNPWGTDYSVALPASLLMNSTALSLRFEVPRAATPASLKINDDSRVLGIAIRSLRID